MRAVRMDRIGRACLVIAPAIAALTVPSVGFSAISVPAVTSSLTTPVRGVVHNVQSTVHGTVPKVAAPVRQVAQSVRAPVRAPLVQRPAVRGAARAVGLPSYSSGGSSGSG